MGMDLFDAMNMMDSLSGGSSFGGDLLGGGGGLLGGGGGSSGFIGVITIVAIIVFIAAIYMFNSYTLMHIGRKAGLQNDWMAFVPFAGTVYWLKVADEPWWKMFIFGDWLVYSWLLNLIINAISNGAWATFADVLVTLYLGACLAYNIYFRIKFYRSFGITPVLGLQVATPVGLFGVPIIDALIAFTDNYQYVGAYAVAPDRPKVGSAPKPGIVNAGITGLSGMYAGQTLPMAPGEEMIIGRDNSICNLIVDQNAEKLSRRHCSVVYDSTQGVYRVTDYSTNGTYIEGGNRLIANMPTSVNRGSVISLGNRENRFRLN